MKTLSSYYVTVPLVAPLSGLTCTSFTLRLFVWNGIKTAVPLNPIYELTKDNLTLSNGSVEMNISRLVNDYIEFMPNIASTTSVVDGDNQLWVKWDVLYNTDNVDDYNIPSYATTDLAVKGYGYTMEGINPMIPNVLINSGDYLVHENTTFIVPILVSELNSVNVSVISYPANNINQSYILSATTNSDSIVKNIVVVVSEAGSDEYIEIIYGGEMITLLIENECIYTPKNILFLNKNGAVQSLTFFKKSVEKFDVTRENYESSLLASDGFHNFVNFNVNGRTSFTANSGFVDEDMNDVFKQLLLSSAVWELKNGIKYPINVSQNSIEFKTRNNDKLINYTFNFDYSYNEIS